MPFKNCKQTTCTIIIFQKGIKRLFFCCWLNVDLDIVRFVLELTKNKWLYRYHIIRRGLFVMDRIVDMASTLIFVTVFCNSTPIWPDYVYPRISLGIYIVLRLISFALYSNTLPCKCYAVRTFISTVISSLSVMGITMATVQKDMTITIWITILFCETCIYPIVLAFRKLKFMDDPLQFLPEMKNNRWLIRYHEMRTYLMLSDRGADIVALFLNLLYYGESAPHRHVCSGVYIILRLISLALCYNTELCECYAVRTLIPWIISSLFCNVALSIPLLSIPDKGYIGYVALIGFTLASFCVSLPILFINQGN